MPGLPEGLHRSGQRQSHAGVARRGLDYHSAGFDEPLAFRSTSGVPPMVSRMLLRTMLMLNFL